MKATGVEVPYIYTSSQQNSTSRTRPALFYKKYGTFTQNLSVAAQCINKIWQIYKSLTINTMSPTLKNSARNSKFKRSKPTENNIKKSTNLTNRKNRQKPSQLRSIIFTWNKATIDLYSTLNK